MTQVKVDIKPFDALSLRELHACLMLRGAVFVVGQGICSVADVDRFDPLCHHAMLWQGQALVGTARLLPIDEAGAIKVGRVAVDKACRGRGLGAALMRAVQSWIDQRPGGTGVMSAQAYLQRWYAAQGWVAVGETYNEAGIEHIKMVYRPADAG